MNMSRMKRSTSRLKLADYDADVRSLLQLAPVTVAEAFVHYA